jgi:hypothetical protein
VSYLWPSASNPLNRPSLKSNDASPRKSAFVWVRDVILVVQLVDEDVVDHRVEERRVGAGPDARKDVGGGGRPGESRIDVDDDRPVFLGLADPLEGHRVVLGHVTAFDEDRLAVLEVGPVVGHRPPDAPGRCRRIRTGRC